MGVSRDINRARERVVTELQAVPSTLLAAPVTFDAGSTQYEWQGADLYVAAELDAVTLVRAKLYAQIEGQGRAFVASGWLGPGSLGQTRLLTAGTRICGARGARARWFAELQVAGQSADLPEGAIKATLVGANGLADVPPETGVIVGASIPALGAAPPPGGQIAPVYLPGGATSSGEWDTEIVACHVFNTDGGAPHFLQFHDRAALLAAPGDVGAVPVFSLQVPAGAALSFGPETFRGRRFGSLGCVVAESPFAWTWDVDTQNLRWRVWVR